MSDRYCTYCNGIGCSECDRELAHIARLARDLEADAKRKEVNPT